MFRPLRLALIGGPTAALIAWKRQEVSSFFDKKRSAFFSSNKLDERFTAPPEADIICAFNIGSHHTEGFFHYYPKNAKFSNKLFLKERDGQIEQDLGSEEDTNPQVHRMIFPDARDSVLFPNAHDAGLVWTGIAIPVATNVDDKRQLLPGSISWAEIDEHPAALNYYPSVALVNRNVFMVEFLKSLREAAEAFAEDVLVINEERKIKYMFCVPDWWCEGPSQADFWSALKEAGFPIKGDEQTGISTIELAQEEFEPEDMNALFDVRLASQVEVYPSSFVAAVGHVNCRTKDEHPTIQEEFEGNNMMTIVSDDSFFVTGAKFGVNNERLYNVECLQFLESVASPIFNFKVELSRAMSAKHGGTKDSANLFPLITEFYYPWKLEKLLPDLIKAGRLQKSIASHRHNGKEYTLSEEDVNEMLIQTVMKPFCVVLSSIFQGPPQGSEKIFLRTDDVIDKGEVLSAVIQMARVEQTFSQFGYRVVDIGPTTKDLIPFSPSQRHDDVVRWIQQHNASIFSKNWDNAAKKEGIVTPPFEHEGEEEGEGYDRQVYDTVHDKYVRKLNYDPTIQESSESVKTVPIELVVMDKDIQRKGLSHMGSITLRALFLPNVKRTITATDGAIEILMKQGAVVGDGEDEDDFDGLSGNDVEGID